MTDWSRISRDTLERLAATLPDDMSLKARKVAIEAAYPFRNADGAAWPRRAWQKARREYLARFREGGKRPTGLEHLPRDPITGRPVI